MTKDQSFAAIAVTVKDIVQHCRAHELPIPALIQGYDGNTVDEKFFNLHFDAKIATRDANHRCLFLERLDAKGIPSNS